MEHRLIVVSECGYIFRIIDGQVSVFYDTDDDSDYFGKIARYNDKVIAIGGNTTLHMLTKENDGTYQLCKINLLPTNHNETVRFIDDFMVLACSSHNYIFFLPMSEIYPTLLDGYFPDCNRLTIRLNPFSPFRFNGFDFINDKFILGGNFYGRSLWDSGVMVINKDLTSFFVQEHGWRTTKVAAVDNKLYTLCNYVYNTEKKTCLVVDGKIVVAFDDIYELNDFSVTDTNIYLVGRYIIPQEDTTLNRGVVLILDKWYNLLDIYSLKGSGTLMGCLSEEKDYANDMKLCDCTAAIKSKINNRESYNMKIDMVR